MRTRHEVQGHLLFPTVRMTSPRCHPSLLLAFSIGAGPTLIKAFSIPRSLENTDTRLLYLARRFFLLHHFYLGQHWQSDGALGSNDVIFSPRIFHRRRDLLLDANLVQKDASRRRFHTYIIQRVVLVMYLLLFDARKRSLVKSTFSISSFAPPRLSNHRCRHQ